MPMMPMTARSSRSENPLPRSISSPKWGRHDGGPGRSAISRVGVGLRSLRGPRLAWAANLRSESGLAFHGDVGAEALERLVAEPFHLHQIGRLLEVAVFLPVIDDPLCGSSADAGEQRELRDVGGVDVDHAARSRLLRSERGEADGGNDNCREKNGEGLPHDLVSPFVVWVLVWVLV